MERCDVGQGERRLRPAGAERARQGAQPVERRPQVAGHELRPGQLQDGAVQETAAFVPPGLRLPPVPQQPRPQAQSQKVQVPVRPSSFLFNGCKEAYARDFGFSFPKWTRHFDRIGKLQEDVDR